MPAVSQEATHAMPPVTDSSLAPIFAELADRFAAGFPVERPAVRTVGREAEFPIVSATGQAVDVRGVVERAIGPDVVRPRRVQGDEEHARVACVAGRTRPSTRNSVAHASRTRVLRAS